MDTNILSSPAKAHKPNTEWDTPTRAKIRSLRAAGKSYREIRKLTDNKLSRSTIQKIIKASSSRRSRKNKTYKPKLLNARDLRRIQRYVETSWETRVASWAAIKRDLNLNVSASTIRRALKTLGYRRCIACPRPFINKEQAKRRLQFCINHYWWGTRHWGKVIWSDEASFETGKRGRV